MSYPTVTHVDTPLHTPPKGLLTVGPMAKLTFHYSTMNAGKSTALLQASHNYLERGMQTCLLTASRPPRRPPGKLLPALKVVVRHPHGYPLDRRQILGPGARLTPPPSQPA